MGAMCSDEKLGKVLRDWRQVRPRECTSCTGQAGGDSGHLPHTLFQIRCKKVAGPVLELAGIAKKRSGRPEHVRKEMGEMFEGIAAAQELDQDI